MDIFTHAGIGLIAASPFLGTRPELALGVVAGSVLPDLDAVCRMAGKRTFLRAHQTWSHALPVQFAASVILGAVAGLTGWPSMAIGVGLFAGMLGHSLLDITNTYGVMWLAPFSRRRRCLEWVFFIDATVILAVLAGLAVILPTLVRGEAVSPVWAILFLSFLAVYVFIKGWMRRRAARFCPGTKSLVPSALLPWRYLGARREGTFMKLFQVNALTGAQKSLGEVPLLDEPFAAVLESLPDFRLMRELSPEYHVIASEPDGETTHLVCRDLRVRNFNTRFGDLEVWLDAGQRIVRRHFHV